MIVPWVDDTIWIQNCRYKHHPRNALAKRIATGDCSASYFRPKRARGHVISSNESVGMVGADLSDQAGKPPVLGDYFKTYQLNY